MGQIYEYEITGVQHRTGFSIVCKAFHFKFGKVALKFVKHIHDKQQGCQAKRVIRELEFHASLKHRSIIPVLDDFRWSCFHCIVLPWAELGSLEQLIGEKFASGAPIGLVQTIMVQVFEALLYLHSKGYVHSDVKMQNILLSDDINDPVVWLADFGSIMEIENTHGIVGTWSYLAPEVVLKKGWDEKADIFAAGVVLCKLFTGMLPFAGNAPREKPVVRLASPKWKQAKDLKDLLMILLSVSPDRRPSAEQALEHPALREVHGKRITEAKMTRKIRGAIQFEKWDDGGQAL
jgi:serine/threonine protein kinase